jgi:hypothetical protein
MRLPLRAAVPVNLTEPLLGRRPVGEQDEAGSELPHVDQTEREPALEILEQGAALTNDDRADHHPQLVEDARRSEVGGEVCAADHEQFAIGSGSMGS